MNENINVHDNYPSSEQSIEVPAIKVMPLKRICVTLGELPTAYIETMSYYEMLLWFIAYLRDNIIPAVNGNAEATQEVQEVVMNLQQYINDFKDSIDQDVEDLETYINNYFDNLDVQDEINNKLDAMLEQGQLEQIIEQYIQSSAVWAFDTVADMQNATNLVNGSYARTLGYYSINDGGGALYKITNSTSNLYHQESISDNLYANLIVENNTINIKQLGAKCNIYPTITNKTDSKNYLLEYETLCSNNNIQYKLYIPNGLWFFSETLITRHLGVNIVGETNFSRDDYSGTIILPYGDNQGYIWKIGGTANYSDTSAIPVSQMVTQTNIDNLTFSTGTFIDGLNYKVTNGCLILDRCDFMTIPNINIMHFNGNGLVVRTSWEVNIGNLMFRNHSGFGTNQMLWDDASSVTGVSANISAFDINNMMSEGCDGSLIYSKGASGASHNHIGHINIENAFSSGTQANLTDNEDVSSYTPIDLIKGFFRSLIIDSINFFDNNNKKSTYDGTTYYFRSLFRDIEDTTSGYNSKFNVVVGTMTFRTASTHEVIAYSRNSYYRNRLTIGTLSALDEFPNNIFDYKFGLITKIGAITNSDIIPTYKDSKDAYQYAIEGKNTLTTSVRPTEAKCVFATDVLAPTFCHLVSYNDDGIKGIRLFNSIGSKIKARILYRTINTSTTSATLFSKNSSDASQYTNFSCPNSTDTYVWSNWSNSIDSVIGKDINIRGLGLNIAKIEIAEGE